MITEQEAEKLELEFMDAMPEWRNYSKEKAKGLYKAWNHLWALMERENNFSDNMGSILDWQIGNWASDLTMVLHNASLYEEVIKVNEQILQIKWSSNKDNFYENAKRDIADAYADLGNIEECYQLYEKYLKEDPLWGWGWIGYYRQLSDHDDSRFEVILDELYRRIEGRYFSRQRGYLP
jgi:tetratricopeptide (TPR) repeat protein